RGPAGAGPLSTKPSSSASVQPRIRLPHPVRLDLVVALGLVARLVVRCRLPAVGLDLGLFVLELLVRHGSSFGISHCCHLTRRTTAIQSSTAPRHWQSSAARNRTTKKPGQSRASWGSVS